MTSFYDLLTTRQACRNYDERPVEKEKLVSLAEAAHLAPSACNSQPWKFITVSGKAAEKVRQSVQKEGRNSFTEKCPSFTLVIEEKAQLAPAIAAKIPEQTFAQMDIGIAVAHYILMATDLGLSTCVIGWMNEEKLTEDFGISDGEKLRLVIAVGYAAEDDKIRPKKRKDINEVAEFTE